MPLSRAIGQGYDVARMTFGFTMIDEQQKTVRCAISASAMDELDDESRGKGTLPCDRDAQFVRLKDAIEAIASRLFDAEPDRPAMVRIFHHHTWFRRQQPAVSPRQLAHRLADNRGPRPHSPAPVAPNSHASAEVKKPAG